MAEAHSPKVTVRIPAYNHEKYIHECLESVLNQTFQDFEIVITDDGSSDRTVEIIREFNDTRISLEVLDKNYGSAYAIENCLKKARGEYVANLCSDDAWELNKLEKQVAFLDKNPQFDAVFTKVKIIDEDSNPFAGQHFYLHAFEVKNRTKEEWLNHFFYVGNCLCMPSVMIRRSVYEDLHYQDKRMASLNDFDFWVRFSLQHTFYILEDTLTKFRLRANEANASGNRLDNHIRCLFEYKQILHNYLLIKNAELLRKIFPECDKYGVVKNELIPYFLGRLAIDTKAEFKQLWGLETIFNLIKNEKIMETLDKQYGFSYTDFYKFTSEKDVYRLAFIRHHEQEMYKTKMEMEHLNAAIMDLMNTIKALQ